MSRLSILMILTSSATMGETGEPTGVWFEELATPHFAFVNAGAAVTLTSIAGGAVPVDPRSRKPIGENEASVDRFLGDETGMAALTSSSAISEVDDADHDAVFLPGVTGRCGVCRTVGRWLTCSVEHGGLARQSPRSVTDPRAS